MCMEIQFACALATNYKQIEIMNIKAAALLGRPLCISDNRTTAYFSLRAAWAAARRAIGTLKGLQET
jgi:hypothetical protein